jgi:hypothetical protein
MATAEQSQPPAVSSITPAKQPALRQQHHDAMLQAAKNTLELGVKNGINIHVFGAPYKSKVGMKGSRGSRDAIGKFDKNGNDQTGLALAPWTGKYLAANPCIRLDYSGLVAIDVDHGFEQLTDEEMIAKGEANGLPRTYTVRTGRANGGATFFYIGTRTLSDCAGLNGFKAGELSGDIKHHGHVAAAGSLHKSGNVYRCINDVPFAALPESWRDYTNAKSKSPKPTPFEEDLQRKAEQPGLESQRIKANLEYRKRLRADLLAGRKRLVKAGELVPRGERLKHLIKYAGTLRKQQIEPEAIRIALDLHAIRKCWDGLNFIVTHKTNLDAVARWSADWREGDYVITGPVFLYEELMIQESKRPLTREERQAAVIKALPARVRASEVYTRMEAALKDTVYRFKPRGKHLDRLYTALGEAGFEVERLSDGSCWWVRKSLSANKKTEHM